MKALSNLRGGSDRGEGKERARAIKEEGNELWKEGEYELAAQKFTEALHVLEEEESLASSTSERINCMNNLAACNVKTRNFYEAVRICSDVLQMDPQNRKARLRRGAALEGMKLYSKAAADMVLILIQDAKVSFPALCSSSASTTPSCSSCYVVVTLLVLFCCLFLNIHPPDPKLPSPQLLSPLLLPVPPLSRPLLPFYLSSLL